MHNFIDMTGQKLYRLTVLNRAENSPAGKARWLCRCDCGKESIVTGCDLRSGNHQSCGCLQREMTSIAATTHGKTSSPEYQSWHGMIQRCENPSHVAYHKYGSRGITVCEQWKKSFETFLNDMGERPEPKHLYSIERKNNDGNYEPTNCRWATLNEQAINKRLSKTSTTGFKGIRRTQQDKYEVRIQANKKRIHIGNYKDLNEAVKARKSAEEKYWNKSPSQMVL